MKKRFVGLLAVVLVLFGFTACGGAASGAAADKMEIAETMAVSPPAAAGGHMPEAPALEETERETGETLTSRSQTRKLIRPVELQMETGDGAVRCDGKTGRFRRKSHFAYCQPYSQDPDGPSG